MKLSKKTLKNTQDRYTEALLNGDSKEALICVNYFLSEGLTEIDLYNKVFSESLKIIGQMWHDKKISISHENRASGITLELMTKIRSNFNNNKPSSPIAIVTTPKSDSHIIGARMFADFLLIDGWNVDFLTNQIPVDDLVNFIIDRSPNLVALSATMDVSVKECDEMTLSICKIPDPPKIMWGGPGLNRGLVNYDNDLKKSDILKNKIQFSSGLSKFEMESTPDFICCTDKFFQSSECSLFLNSILGKSKPENIEATLILIGSNIKKHRIKLGISQQVLSEKASIDRAFLSSIENGKRNISVLALSKIADKLDISVRDLVEN